MATSIKAFRIKIGFFVGAALLAASQTHIPGADNDSIITAGRSTLAACSPDGAFYVAANRDGRISYTRAQDGKLMRTFYQCSAQKLAFSPDGHLLACAGGGMDNPTVQVWNLTNGRGVISIQTSLSAAPCLCFSSDGSVVAFTVSATHVAAWHIGKREKVWSTDLGIRIATLYFDKQDGALVMQAADGSVRKLRPADGSVMTARTERNP